MFTSQSAEQSLNLPCRQISPILGSRREESHRFIVGTSILPSPATPNNELHLLRLHQDTNEIITDMILDHPTGEVWNMTTCPHDSNLVFTVGGAEAEPVLWKIPEEGFPPLSEDYDEYNDDLTDMEPPRSPMERVVSLGINRGTTVESAIWNASEDAHSDLVTLARSEDSTVVSRWDMSGSEAREVCQVVVPGISGDSRRAAWDPHNPNLVGHVHSSSVLIHDLRSSSSGSTSLSSLHRYDVTDLDYNPNRPNVLVTGGSEGLLKFWDLRYVQKKPRPIKICRGGHTHALTRVRYNPFHDQLVLSSGSDSNVNLWRVSSISSAPLLELSEHITGAGEEEFLGSDDGDGGSVMEEESGPDIRVMKCDNQESVYDVAWSGCDAWCFGSVSFDGNVVLSHVPSKEKYKILL